MSIVGAAGPPSRVRVPVRLLYGIGEVAITVSMVLFGLFFLFFYTAVMKLPATLVGIAAAIGLAWDAVIDPYIGYRSDHSRSRWGRRHGFMLMGALTMGASFWLLLSPPLGLGTVGLFLWLLLTTLVFRFTCALYRIPYLSLGAELSSDYQERTTIVGVRSFFGLCGTLAAASLSFVLFFPNTEPGVDPKLNFAGYSKMALFWGIIMTVCGLLSLIGTRRGPTAGRTAPVPITPSATAYLRGFAAALRNRSFRTLWFSYTLFFLAVVLNAVVALHYFTWYVRIIDSEVLSRIQTAFYVGALFGVAGWILISAHAEKLTLFIIAMLATASLMTLATVLFGQGRLLGVGNPLPLIIGHVVAGVFASALWVLPDSMLADVADEDELHTGLRREGLLFGMFNFGQKIGAGLSLLIAGVLLDVFVGLSPGGTLDQDAAQRVGILYGVVPAGLLLVAIASLKGYRLNRVNVGAVQVTLNNRRNVAGQPMTTGGTGTDSVPDPVQVPVG